MRKKVTIIWNDGWHPKEDIEPAVDVIFAGEGWQVTKTERARDLLEPGGAPDLAVFYTNGRPQGEDDLSDEEQEAIAVLVERGMGILYIHAGLTVIEEKNPFYRTLNSGRFDSHPPKCDVTMTPIGGLDHPILKDVPVFTAFDEHYYCPMDPQRTQVLMCAASGYSVTASAWCHAYGAGRVCSITQGHTLEMQTQPGMLRLVGNAALWLTKQA